MKEHDINCFGAFFLPSEIDIINKIDNIARECNVKFYLIGGFIRDRILQLQNKKINEIFDLDIVVENISAISFGKLIHQRLGGNFIILDQKFDICRIVLDNKFQIDITLAKSEQSMVNDNRSQNEIRALDVVNRDFTINTLIYSPDTPNCIIDYNCAWQDLAHKQIRMVSSHAFQDDPLRILRAFRIAAELNFVIDDDTLQQIKQNYKLLSNVSYERINYEIFRIYNLESSFKTIKLMADFKILELIYKPLVATNNIPPNSYHHLGLFDHSIETYNQVELNFNEIPNEYKSQFAQIISNNLTILGATKLAGMLHDIGKPATWQVTDSGRHTFIKHDSIGAKMILELSEQHKWSHNLTKFVANLVKWHLRPGSLYNIDKAPSNKALNRFYSQVDELTPALILVALADLASTLGSDFERAKRAQLKMNFLKLLNDYSQFKQVKTSLVKYLDGNDIVKLLDITPGPIVGYLLKSLNQAQLDGEIANGQQAREYVINQYKLYSK